MHKKYDILWKGVIEEVFDDLLRFIFPKAEEVFDMSRGFEFLDKELAEMYPESGKRPATRHADKLVKAYRRDGSEEWVLCHVEVQGVTKKQDRALFGERMFRYYYRIFDRHKKPLTALAIFTAWDGWKMPDRYEYHFLGTSHVYRYNTYCIMEPTDEELEKSDNPFAVVVLAARKALQANHLPDEISLNLKIMITRHLLEKKKFSKNKIRSILTFLDNYIVFRSPETNHTFKEEINKVTNKKNPMGIIEAVEEMRREEGREEAKKNFVKKLLIETELSMAKIAFLADVKPYYVKKMRQGLSAQ